MAWFTAKEWKNRLVEFAGRRSLKNVTTNETTVYDVTRNEGQVSQEGDAFSAATMNDLEHRISEGFSAAEEANSQLSSEFFAQTWAPSNGYDPFGATTLLQVFSVNEGWQIAQGVPPGLSPYATVICFGKAEYRVLWYIDVFGATAIYSTNQNRWIVPSSSVIDLGTGTSFDVKTQYSNYRQLTVNDFVVEPEALPDQVLGSKGTHTVNSSNVYAWMRFTKTKNYNAETGILTAYVTPSGGYGSSTAGVGDTALDNRPVHAYLIKS